MSDPAIIERLEREASRRFALFVAATDADDERVRIVQTLAFHATQSALHLVRYGVNEATLRLPGLPT